MQDAQAVLEEMLAEMDAERLQLAREQELLGGVEQALARVEERLAGAAVPEGQVLQQVCEDVARLRAHTLEERGRRLQRWSEKVADCLERLQQVKSLASLGELSASVAHEIRNPLCGIQLLVEVLQTKMDPDDSRNRLLDNLHREAEKMAKVVTNLLHFARRYEPNTAQCTLGDIVQKSIETVKSHLKKKDMQVVVHGATGACNAELDAALVLQVFRNILHNSVDASPSGSVVHVYLQGTDESDAVAVSFRDEGAGIPIDLQGRIFDPFFTSKRNGVGLGLSVSKRIVEAHRGRIEVESTPGEGTTFTVVFPRKAHRKQQRLAA